MILAKAPMVHFCLPVFVKKCFHAKFLHLQTKTTLSVGVYKICKKNLKTRYFFEKAVFKKRTEWDACIIFLIPYPDIILSYLVTSKYLCTRPFVKLCKQINSF